jgi:dihydrofolate synthase/folylpolyglutamate synthase
MNRPATLADWLAYLETLHPKAIALGLDRVAQVHARMRAPLDCPVVTVTGTNGKGSTCAMLESVLRSAGYRTGLYTSPHLLRYNERVRVVGEPQDDAALVAAFNAVEDARGDVPLTYFEYGTLAAFHAFSRAGLDAVILEVGLGGRLDAVNVISADVAVVTTIDLDHMDYLGPTRADIAYEKAGIFRAARPVVCAEPDPPPTMTEHARAIGAPFLQIGRDFGYVAEDRQWRYWGPGGDRFGLPVPSLRGAYQLANAATALAVVGLLHDRLHVDAGAIRAGLCAVSLPGRFQVLSGPPRNRPRRRAQSARRAGARGNARDDGILSANDCRVRHARRQGHRRSDCRGQGANRLLVRRGRARSARRHRRVDARQVGACIDPAACDSHVRGNRSGVRCGARRVRRS